jgi:hypothetical protein
MRYGTPGGRGSRRRRINVDATVRQKVSDFIQVTEIEDIHKAIGINHRLAVK